MVETTLTQVSSSQPGKLLKTDSISDIHFENYGIFGNSNSTRWKTDQLLVKLLRPLRSNPIT